VAGTAFSERFQREAEAIAALSIPTSATLFDVGPDYLVMELVEGPTLARPCGGAASGSRASSASRGRSSMRSRRRTRKHIVHRDLKAARTSRCGPTGW
jgi:serine/threonine protein kinase